MAAASIVWQTATDGTMRARLGVSRLSVVARTGCWEWSVLRRQLRIDFDSGDVADRETAVLRAEESARRLESGVASSAAEVGRRVL